MGQFITWVGHFIILYGTSSPQKLVFFASNKNSWIRYFINLVVRRGREISKDPWRTAIWNYYRGSYCCGHDWGKKVLPCQDIWWANSVVPSVDKVVGTIKTSVTGYTWWHISGTSGCPVLHAGPLGPSNFFQPIFTGGTTWKLMKSPSNYKVKIVGGSQRCH